MSNEEKSGNNIERWNQRGKNGAVVLFVLFSVFFCLSLNVLLNFLVGISLTSGCHVLPPFTSSDRIAFCDGGFRKKLDDRKRHVKRPFATRDEHEKKTRAERESKSGREKQKTPSEVSSSSLWRSGRQEAAMKVGLVGFHMSVCLVQRCSDFHQPTFTHCLDTRTHQNVRRHRTNSSTTRR